MRVMHYVQRWRQRQRQAEPAALTLWLPLDVKCALEAMARQRHCTPSDLVQQALITCYPESTGVADTAPRAALATLLTDTAQLRGIIQDELRALRRESLPAPQGHVLPLVPEIAPVLPAAVPVPRPGTAPMPELPHIPPFDPTTHRLGKLCKRGHEWGTSGRSLKHIAQGGCLVCAAKSTRKRHRDTR